MKTLLISILFMAGCAGQPIAMNLNPNAIAQANEIYSPFIEKSFCVSGAGIHNVLIGGPFSSPIPLCNKGDIVMHTHPSYAESGANFLDCGVWGEYQKRYGNTLFGVMAGKNDFRIYHRSGLAEPWLNDGSGLDAE